MSINVLPSKLKKPVPLHKIIKSVHSINNQFIKHMHLHARSANWVMFKNSLKANANVQRLPALNNNLAFKVSAFHKNCLKSISTNKPQ